MKIEGFLSTSRYIADAYLKIDHLVLNGIIEILMKVDKDTSGGFLLIGDNFFITPKGLTILASNMAVPGNVFSGVDEDDIERLWDDLYLMEVIEPRLYYLMKKIKR